MTEFTSDFNELATGQETFTEPLAVIPVEELVEGTGRMAKYWATVKRTGQWALVATELLPTNEVLRGGLFAAGEIISRSPAMGAATIGLSTFVLEAAGGLAAAGLIDTEKGKNLFEVINQKSQQVRLPMTQKFIKLPSEVSNVSKVGWTFMGGTVVGMGIEQRENPSRSLERNRRYSLLTSAWLAGITAVAGALASEGINVGLNDPKKGSLLALGLVGTVAAGRWIKRRFVRNKKDTLPKAG
ncbi:MAG TPA: hypothetical protein VFI84_04370 [Candidatus Saccharimonadales bacterium]|nr:hypothetical protein [Candidatus Saccharimonadales bacterium]